jgi:hypothetical protein
MVKKLLYVGAGCNIKTVVHFKDATEFIFIDTQPRSNDEKYSTKFNKNNYVSDFIRNLIEECTKYGFLFHMDYQLDKSYYKKILSWKQCYYNNYHKRFVYINPTLLVFRNIITNQTLKYYISVNIKLNVTNMLHIDIESCDGILVNGYYPEIEILRYFDKPKAFYGYTNANYTIDTTTFSKETDNNIIYFLQNCICNTQYYFDAFYMIDEETGETEQYVDFLELTT